SSDPSIRKSHLSLAGSFERENVQGESPPLHFQDFIANEGLRESRKHLQHITDLLPFNVCFHANLPSDYVTRPTCSAWIGCLVAPRTNYARQWSDLINT